MSEVVDTLVIKVEGDGQSAIDTLNKVASSLEKISKATGGQNLGDLSKKLDSIEQTVNSFKTNSLAALNDIVGAISNLKKLNISSKIPDGIKSIGQAAKSIKESDISKIDQVADSLNGVKEAQSSTPKVDLSGVKSAAARTAKATTSDKLEESKENISAPSRKVSADLDALKAKGSASGLDNKELDAAKVKAVTIKDIIGSWKTRLSESNGWIGAIKKGFSIVGTVSKKAITSFFSVAKKGFSVLSSTIKSIGSGIKRAFSNSILGKFTSTLKSAFSGLLRIAKFRLFRTIVKSFTQDFKTGIDNMYQYSKAFSGEYAKNMDRLASANLTFKNSIGAMIAPIVNAVTPFLDKLLTRLTEVGNKIAMLFAGLSGKSTYTKAIRATTEYAKANDKASKSTEKVKDKTEELKRSFAGLDEITVIGDNSTNPAADSAISDAAKSSDTPDYTTMFKEAPVQIAGLSKDLLDSLKGIDWSGLGDFFGKKLNGILDNIDWASIQKKAQDFATRLYTFINGFVRSVDWTLVGKTIAEALKTGLIFLDTLINNLDFSAIGRAFGNIINGLADPQNAILLARVIVGWITGGLTIASNALRTIDWGKISNLIVTFITNFDFKKISDSVINFLNSFATALSNIQFDKIGEAFRKGISKINWSGIWDGIVDTATNALKGIGDLLGIDFDTSKLNEAFKSWKEPIGKLLESFKSLAEKILPVIVEKLLPAAVDLIGNIVSALSPVIDALAPVISTILEAVSRIFKAISPVLPKLGEMVGKLVEMLSPFIEKVVDIIAQIVEKLAPVLGDIFDVLGEIFEFLTPLFDAIGDSLEPIIDIIGGVLDQLGGIIKFLKGVFTGDWEEAWEGIKQIFSGIVEFISGVIDSVLAFFGTSLEDLRTTFENIGKGIADFFSGVWDGIVNVFQNVGQWFADVFSAAWDGIKNIWDAVAGYFKFVWDSIVNVFKVVGQWFADRFSQAWEGIKKVWSAVAGYFKFIWDSIVNVFKVVGQWFSDRFSQAWQGIVNIWKNVGNFFRNIWDGIVNVFKGVGDWFRGIFDKAVSGIKNAFNGVKQWFANLWQGIWNVIKTPINWIIDGINSLIGGLNNVKIDVPDWVPFIGGKRFGFDIPKIPKLAEGGFPEDGLFFANHNELVGQFSNGKTAVANNEQIVEGISQGVSSANEEQNGLLKEQNRLLRMLLEKRSTIDVTTITNAMSRKNQRDGRVTVPVAT